MAQISYLDMGPTSQEPYLYYHRWLHSQPHNTSHLQAVFSMDPNRPLNESESHRLFPARRSSSLSTDDRFSPEVLSTRLVNNNGSSDCPNMTADNHENLQIVGSDNSLPSNFVGHGFSSSNLLLDPAGTCFFQEPSDYDYTPDPSDVNHPFTYYSPERLSSVPSNLPVNISPVHWYNNHSLSEQSNSEDKESSELQELMEISGNRFSLRQQNQPYVCQMPGCGTTFSKKGDYKRHWTVKHNPNAERHVCGCCKDGTSQHFLRKDKLREHKIKVHNHTKDLKMKLCPHRHGDDGLELLYFCSAEKLQHHNQMLHRHEGEAGCSDPSTGLKRSNENDVLGASKRVQLHPTDPTNDETKYPSEISLYKKLDLYKSLHTSGHKLTAVSETVTISNVCFTEFVKLSEKAKEIHGPRANPPHSGSYVVLPLVLFNALSRSVKLQGSKELICDLLRMLRPKTQEHYPSPLCLLRSKPHLPTRNQKQENLKPKIFAMKEIEDCELIALWHRNIITCLPRILQSRIQSDYSASLVRTGKCERCSRAAIHIQSNKMPSSTAKEHIRKQIVELVSPHLSFSKEQIQFFEGRLKTIAGCTSHSGSDQSDESDNMDEVEDEEYPWYTRYHATPGPGASIGLTCTKQISATIGCYVNIDTSTYVLTVKHLVTKSYEHLSQGATDKTTVVSPAVVDADDLIERFEQYLSDLDLELSSEDHLGSRYCQDVPVDIILALPESTRNILNKRDLIAKDLNKLKNDPQLLNLGSVFQSNDSDMEDLPGLPSDSHPFRYHLDWALFTVVSSRLGSNRHRYHFNQEQNMVNFYDGDTDTCGAGEQFVATGTVTANDEVHFVGQATGRQSGEVNAARVLICHNNQISHEWAVILSPDQQGNPERHRGDSGASIIRNHDNRLIGLLWACHGGLLIFTPIEVVFADIQNKLGATEICLPPYDQPPTQPLLVSDVEEICRDKTKEPKRPRRRFRSAMMQTDPRKTVQPLGLPRSVFPTTTKPQLQILTSKKEPAAQKLATTTHDSDRVASSMSQPVARLGPGLAEDKENKHSLQYILTDPTQFELQKRRTMQVPRSRRSYFRGKSRVNTWPCTLALSSVSVN
ncbi:hypothetical protein PVAG01_05504 [Phlyctema vagabunda]|uniref:C2H2-type domain-containing protein n=1 Tax=Phlyctema vagabunda TaxID=108571 RepID=A0ABR4PKZ7_9HELO